ncbi:putative TauD/TfdA-like domain, taurine dioxygenase TauD-like superfamily [Helianthus debilis subsp. tardiflorus]
MEMATGRLFQEIQLPEQKSYNDGIIFPLVLSPNTTQVKLCAFKEAIRDHKPWLESLLQKNGAILFRGFPVISPSDFNDVVEAFGFPESLYVGGRASRTKVIGRIYNDTY